MTIQRDQLWKLAFRNLMPQFVKFFFPKNYDEVNWDKDIIFLDKELQTIQANSRPKNRIADVLVLLHLKNGQQLYIFLHIEIQGYFDKDFGFRVHQMCYRIEDKYGSTPAMLTVFTDDDPSFHPKEYRSETWGSGHLTFFNTYKVMENHPSTYADPDSIVSMIMETVYHSTHLKMKDDDDVMKLFLLIVRKLFSKGYSKEHIYLVIAFIQAHVKFGNSENYRIFEEKLVNMEQYEEIEDLVTFFDLETKLKRERQKTELERQKTELSVLLMLSKGISMELVANILKENLEDILAIQEKYKNNNPVVDYLNSHKDQ